MVKVLEKLTKYVDESRAQIQESIGIKVRPLTSDTDAVCITALHYVGDCYLLRVYCVLTSAPMGPPYVLLEMYIRTYEGRACSCCVGLLERVGNPIPHA